MARAALFAILLALIAPACAQGLEERACRINFDDCAKDIQAVCSQQIDECNQRHDETVRRCQAASQSNFDACVRWARQNRTDPNSTCSSHRRSFDACSDPRTRQRACNAAAVRCPTRERCDVNFQLCMRDAAALRQERERPPPQEAPQQREAPPAPAPAQAPAPTPEAPQARAPRSALELGNDLVAAAKRPDSARVQRLLEEGAAVNVQDNDGNTPLHYAAWRSSVIIAELLIRNGASVQIANAKNVTPLHYAAAQANGAPVAELLLQAGASVRDPNGWTPLHVAAYNANVSVVELLLRAESPVNAQNKRGETPLRMAACSDKAEKAVVETVTLLLKSGADPNLYGSIAPPIYCSTWRSLRVTELLLDNGGDVNVGGLGRGTPLHGALPGRSSDRKFAIAVIELLLARGANPNAVDERGETPLHSALGSTSDPKLLAIALRGGAKPDSRDNNGRTPLSLHLRGCAGYVSDADCDAKGKRNQTNLGSVELLLKSGADPNAQDGQGRTLLHVAVHAATRKSAPDDPELIKHLVASGADPNAKGKVGKSPLDMAREIESPALRQQMVNALGG